MAIEGVMRSGHVQIRVLDLAAAIHHYTEYYGLILTASDDRRAYLKGWDEFDHHSLVLREADEPGMDHVAFKVRGENDLDRIEGELRERLIAVTQIPAGEQLGVGRRIAFTVPTGHRIELYATCEQVGNGLPLRNADVWPDGLKGMKASRFEHVLLYGPGVEATVALLSSVLGFVVAEDVVTEDGARIGAFLTAACKSHDIAFIEAPEARFHHLAYWLESWDDIRQAADIIRKKNIAIDIGPTRHGISRGLTIYFFDPSGNRLETFCGGYDFYPDMHPITWTWEEAGAGVFYHDRKLNERFLSVVS